MQSLSAFAFTPYSCTHMPTHQHADPYLNRSCPPTPTCTDERSFPRLHFTKGDGEHTLGPFVDFGSAIKSVFMVLNAEDWTDVLDATYEQSDDVVGGRTAIYVSAGLACAFQIIIGRACAYRVIFPQIYFTLLIIFGQMFLVNLVLAAIIEGSDKET